MPIGLFDVQDRAPVFHPDEIAFGRAQCEQQGLKYIQQPGFRPVPLARYVDNLTARWKRALRSGQQMDALRAGYCTVEPLGAPEPSRATH